MCWSIDHGDCREVLRGVADDSLDACVTDPPYELGFMGKKWDGSGVAFQIEMWGEILRVLKPGAHLLAFGGTRTYHRMTCAIEDAGFEVRDSLHWMYGTGMPRGKSVLKPGHEPVVMARKPFIGTATENIAKWGSGSLNVDECRIGPGRWPANVILDEHAADEVDAQTGELKAGVAVRRNGGGGKPGGGGRTSGAYAGGAGEDEGYGDRGGASRFFYVAKASARERNAGCAIGNNHPTVKPIALMRYLVRLVTPVGGIVLDPFCGSGTTGIAALLEGLRFAGIEQSAEYVEIARQRIEHADKDAA